jgi:hypothetical protein
MESKSVSVQAKTLNGAESAGSLHVTIFSPRVVWQRTIIRTSIVGVITLVSLCIPMIHLFTLPLGLVILLATFFRSSKTKAIINQGSVPCPACQKSITINSRRLEFPFKDSCEYCHREVVVSENAD